MAKKLKLSALSLGKKSQQAQKFVPVHRDPKIGTSHGVEFMLFGDVSQHAKSVNAELAEFTSKLDEKDEQANLKLIAKKIVLLCESHNLDVTNDELEEFLSEPINEWVTVQALSFILDQDGSNFF